MRQRHIVNDPMPHVQLAIIQWEAIVQWESGRK